MFAPAAVTAVARFAIFRSCDLPFVSHMYDCMMYAYMYMKIKSGTYNVVLSLLHRVPGIFYIYICVQFAVPHVPECRKFMYEVHVYSCNVQSQYVCNICSSKLLMLAPPRFVGSESCMFAPQCRAAVCKGGAHIIYLRLPLGEFGVYVAWLRSAPVLCHNHLARRIVVSALASSDLAVDAHIICFGATAAGRRTPTARVTATTTTTVGPAAGASTIRACPGSVRAAAPARSTGAATPTTACAINRMIKASLSLVIYHRHSSVHALP